jgi:hypothetical protein
LYIRKEDQILQKLIDQERFLDQQLKHLEKRYSEIEMNNEGLTLKIDANANKEQLMKRAELAHMELRNYFAKLDKKNQTGFTASSSDSTAEEKSSLPAIDS